MGLGEFDITAAVVQHFGVVVQRVRMPCLHLERLLLLSLSIICSKCLVRVQFGMFGGNCAA
jgi:hypothetical protein